MRIIRSRQTRPATFAEPTPPGPPSLKGRGEKELPRASDVDGPSMPNSPLPFWEGLQTAADATNTRIALTNGGRKAELVPRGKSRESAATSGAFRVVSQQVTGRALLADGVTAHEVQLLVHWEPRIRVYRID